MSISTLFSPVITSPRSNSRFNQGMVTIAWEPPQYPSVDPNVVGDMVTFECEYTENYNGDGTTWMTVKRRIPFSSRSYQWVVGKMVKSKTVRIRMRSHNSETQEVSDWSLSDTFAINVFELTAPAIVSPLSDTLYSDYIQIILDETLTKETYNQKVSYTLEYSSLKSDIEWTVIAKDIPFGKNVFRWDVDSLPSSDDYVLRVVAKDWNSEQTARSYVYRIRIQQSGLFLIDTKPPEAVITIDNAAQVTSQLNHVINIFAEDATSEVKSIRMRECNGAINLKLGLVNEDFSDDHCSSIENIVQAKEISNSSKLEWEFSAVDNDGKPVSTTKKIEAMLTDVGGNTSLQAPSRVFLPVFAPNDEVGDFIISVETRQSQSQDDNILTYEVVYVGTSNGDLWILEPFARKMYTIPGNPAITKIANFNGALYLFTFDDLNSMGSVYRHDISTATLIQTFTTERSRASSCDVYRSNLYIGLENGELWKYTGSVFSLVNRFYAPINYLFGNNNYLHIGFQNSDSISLYNGTSILSLGLD